MPQVPFEVWDALDALDALERLRVYLIQTLAACLGAAIICAWMIPRVPYALACVYAGLALLALIVAFEQTVLCDAECQRWRGFVAGFTGHPEAHHV